MKIQSFKANNVHGYLNFNILFREQLTFLIGINGAGKTTALKLMLALITPSFREFCQIDFSDAELICIDDAEITIKAIRKDDETIELIFILGSETIINTFQVLMFSEDEDNKYNIENCRDRIARLSDIFSSLEVVRKIQSLATPFFLGLERKLFEKVTNEERLPINYRHPRYKNILPTSTNQGLLEVQELVFDYTRQIARQQFKISDDFKNKIFKNSFNFIESSSIDLDKIKEELPKIKKRREQFNNAVRNLQIGDISDEIIHFFTRIEETLTKVIEYNSTSKTKNTQAFIDFYTKWFINSHQLDRIDEIITLSGDYQKKISKLKEPLVRLEFITNKFLTESNKSLKVSGEGDIKILIQKNKKTHANSIFQLSSGERQIIIMIAHLIFSSNKNISPIFVIDEPELSLHITWQEIFVDSLIAANPNTQYILATHSPSIIAKVERELLCEDLTKK